MISVRKKGLKAWLGSSFFLIAAALTIVVLVLTLRTYLAPYDAPEANSAPLLRASTVTRDKLYLIARGWDGENTVLVLAPESGKVNRRFEAGYEAVVRLTADKRTLYIYNYAYSGDATRKGTVSALEASTGTVLWEADIPGGPFGPPTRSAWLSADEQLVYLQGSPDNLHPHIFVVDTQAGMLLYDFELPLPYPANAGQAFPRVWKLPWTEALVVASRDRLFSFDLTSGQAGDAIPLFDHESVKRIPLNLPRSTFVWDGTLDSETRQLFLATSTQEILSVDLNARPFTVTPVASLPTGWQFAVGNPLLHYSPERVIYVQVKRSDTPIVNGLEVEEVWLYNTATWTRKAARLNLREQLANAPANPADNDATTSLDLTNYGLALSANGQYVYSLSQKGLLHLSSDASGRLKGTWLDIEGVNTEEFAGLFAVP